MSYPMNEEDDVEYVVFSVRLPAVDLLRIEALTERLNEGRMDQKPYRPKATRNLAAVECIRVGLEQLEVPIPVGGELEAHTPAHLRKAARKARESGMPQSMIDAKRKAEELGKAADVEIRQRLGLDRDKSRSREEDQ